jgi:hypothetical protein
MFTTKMTPAVAQDGKLKEGIEIKNGILKINDNLKYEGGKWYQRGGGEWFYLGVGANPAYETDGDGILNQTLFEGSFEENARVEEEVAE